MTASASAYHLAGHVVGHISLALPFAEARLRVGADCQLCDPGLLRKAAWQVWGPSLALQEDPSRLPFRLARAIAVSCVSGQEAELAAGFQLPLSATASLNAAVASVFIGHSPPGAVAGHLVAYARRCSVALLRRHKHGLSEIANTLEARGHIRSDTATQLLSDTLPRDHPSKPPAHVYDHSEGLRELEPDATTGHLTVEFQCPECDGVGPSCSTCGLCPVCCTCGV